MKAAPSAVGATASTTNYFEQSGPQQTIKRLRSLECEGDSFLGSWSGGAIKAHELDLGAGEVIAQGNHGVVYKGTCRGSTVAIKVLRTQTMRMNKKQLEALQREADIMRELRHPSLLLLMGVCADEGRLAIVTEYVAGRDLSAIVHDSAVQMSLRQQLTIAKGIAQGMTWLHCLKPEPIIHRDLKPANVLVTPEGNVKVCDFGLSCVKEVYDAEAPPRDTVTGTAIYLAPEVLEGMPASEASDVYAFGVLLWELFTRTKPFREIDNPRKLHQAIVDQRQRPPLTDAIPEAVANLIKACWHHDRLARPSFGQVLQTLDAAVVEVSLSHAEARNFWRSLRPQDGQKYPWAVSWDRFIEAFHRYARPKLPLKLFAHSTEAKCARLLLAVQNVDVTRSRDRQEWIVLLEHFARFTHLFGPFRPTILSDFNALCQTRCFHGTIEAKEAERRLAAGKKKKGYLVRLSAKDPSSVTISRWEKGKVRHVRVTRSDEWFHVPLGKEVHRYADLLSFLASPLATKSGRGALGLRKVCDRDSDFAAIHDEAEGAYQGAADSDDDWNGYDEDAIILVDDKAARRRTCPPGQIARP